MTEMTPGQTAAAMHGLATNKALSLDQRLMAALQALDYYTGTTASIGLAEVEKTDEWMIVKVGNETPQAWKDLIEGLAMMSKGQVNSSAPLHCEHDTLTVCADPHKLTKEECAKLDELGFFVDGHDDEDCQPDGYCEASFMSFRFGSA